MIDQKAPPPHKHLSLVRVCSQIIAYPVRLMVASFSFDQAFKCLSRVELMVKGNDESLTLGRFAEQPWPLD